MGGAGGQSATSSSAGGAGGAGGIGGGGGAGGGCVDNGEGSCEPWALQGFLRRIRIQIQTTGVKEELADFPWLLIFDDTRIDYTKTLMGGDDLRFVDAAGAPLSHDVEQWSKGNKSYVWVRIPKVPVEGQGPVTIWMYYNNDTAKAPTKAEEEATWNMNFVSVHHLHAGLNDATSGKHDGTSTSAPTQATGKIAGARDFDGSNNHIILPKEADYDFTTQMTISAWVSVDSFSKTWQAIVTKGDSAWRMHRDNTSPHLGFGWTPDDNSINKNFGGATDILVNATWHHVAIVANGGTKLIYVDGAEDAKQTNTTGIKLNDWDVCIGDNREAQNRFFDGKIDEVRISKVPRSPSWLMLEHATVEKNSQYTAYSQEQVSPP